MATSTIYEFDAEGVAPLPYTWRGKFNLLQRPATFQVCQLKADGYDDILLRLYADGSLLYTTTVTSAEPFILPMSDEYTSFEIEVYGTSRIQTIQVAEDVLELT